MRPRFHRRRGIDVILSDPRGPGRRGFYFDLVVAVAAPVDPESGMTVNLVHVDRWLDEAAKTFAEADDVFTLIEALEKFLAPKAGAQKAALALVELNSDGETWGRDENGWFYRWRRLGDREADGVRRPRRFEGVLRSSETKAHAPPSMPEPRDLEGPGVFILPTPAGWRWAEWRESDPSGRTTRAWTAGQTR